MTTLPHAREDAFRLLRTNLYEHLDEAEFLATKVAPWRDDDTRCAQALIPDLVTVIRGMLVAHSEDETGVCTRCAQEWPCPDVGTIHRLVKSPETEMVALLRRAAELTPAARC